MGEAGATANYCSHCGAALDAGANYCQQCGTQHRETTPADDRTGAETGNNRHAASEDDLLAFRRRVQDRIAEGWDLEYDHGDSVVLADRSFGELWVHAVLLVFTGGAGNLAYAWYCHSYDADRVVMRSDGDDYAADGTDHGALPGTETTDEDGELGSYILGVLLAVGGVAIIAGGLLDPAAIVLGLFFLAWAAWSFPPTRRRLEDRHPVATFGPTRSTETTAVSDPDTPCVVCASPVTEGVERRYREEYVLAGVPLFTTEAGENHYCRDCAMGDVEDVGVVSVIPDADVTSDTDESTPELERR